MIGGLTPVYAAPELFDGRPNVHSDQYSLAIVYQEMLTGVLPLRRADHGPACGPALAQPSALGRLAASDQETIARALSKDPEQRFPSCREMVDSLAQAQSEPPCGRERPPATTGRYSTALARAGRNRGALAGQHPRGRGGGGRSRQLDESAHRAGPDGASICRLWNSSPSDAAYRPTIFIGIGGLAAKTLQTLHRRLGRTASDRSARCPPCNCCCSRPMRRP